MKLISISEKILILFVERSLRKVMRIERKKVFNNNSLHGELRI